MTCSGKIPLPFSSFSMILLTFPSSSPLIFYRAFYLALGRKRTYPLEGFLSALILQTIFSIPADSLLILFLLRLLQSSRCPSFFPLQDLL